MKVAIIGAGNMGGAIARGLAKGSMVATEDIYVSNPSRKKLETLQQAYPGLQVMNSNIEASEGADIVIVAVKPWLMEDVINSMNLKEGQIIVSIAAGIDFKQLEHFAGVKTPMFRAVPNIAIAYMESMTPIASKYATPEQEKLICDMFDEMGEALLVPEEKITATTAIASCGIGFVLKYFQAAMQAGIEMGLYPKDTCRMAAQAAKGAAELILNDPEAHPSAEIDKVTTPGGITIKGINELEHDGFTSAVIKALKACR